MGDVINFLKRNASLINYKFSFIKTSFGNQSFTLLDIGCGNHSPSKTKFVFPNCKYYGVDIDINYNNDESDFSVIEDFYKLDLTKLQFDVIPDNFFDFIRMTHVIEHLYNGDEVVSGLISKLKPRGFFYIEYPGKKSLELPYMYGTLNFYDDHTHVRLYTVAELTKFFKTANCIVLKSGTRRNVLNILAMPVRIIVSLLKRKRLAGDIFWDITGFAEYLYIKKSPVVNLKIELIKRIK